MPTTVHVNTHTYATTHVATNLILSLKQLVMGCGLNPINYIGDWIILERGVVTWLRSRHLKQLVLEIYCPITNYLKKRFDFNIDYGYYPNGDGDLWIDRETVNFALRKAGTVPSYCSYNIIALRSPGFPAVQGWYPTHFRSTSDFKWGSVGAAVGGGSLSSSLHYWKEDK